MDEIFPLPIPNKDGAPQTKACRKCAEASDAYCKKHAMVHQGFEDGTHACLSCIGDLVIVHGPSAAEIMELLIERLPIAEGDDLIHYANVVADSLGEEQHTSILRAVASKALRANMGVREVVLKVISDKALDFLDIPR